jgi:hypothetical protein
MQHDVPKQNPRWVRAGCPLILAGLAFGAIFLLRTPVKGVEDLSTITGRITRYSFVDSYGLRHSNHDYRIYLDSYASTFRIPADFLDVFSKDRFQSDIKEGDLISIAVPKLCLPKVGSNTDTVLIFGIHSYIGTYMDEKTALPIYNSPLGFVYPGLFLLVGISIIMLGKKR